MATMPRIAGAQHRADANGAPQQPGELGCRSRPPFFGLRSSSELDSSVREMVTETKRPHVLRPNPKAHLAQSKRLAEAALEYYNKRKKIRFELVHVQPCNSVPSDGVVTHTLTSLQGPARRVRRNNFSLQSFTTVAQGGVTSVQGPARRVRRIKVPSLDKGDHKGASL